MATAAELALASMDTGFDPNRQNQDFIDPNWAGGPRGAGYDPDAINPLLYSLGVSGVPRLGLASWMNPNTLVSNVVNRMYSPARAQLAKSNAVQKLQGGFANMTEYGQRSMDFLSRAAQGVSPASAILKGQLKADPVLPKWYNPLTLFGTRGAIPKLAVEAAPVTSAINPVTAALATSLITGDSTEPEVPVQQGPTSPGEAVALGAGTVHTFPPGGKGGPTLDLGADPDDRQKTAQDQLDKEKRDRLRLVKNGGSGKSPKIKIPIPGAGAAAVLVPAVAAALKALGGPTPVPDYVDPKEIPDYIGSRDSWGSKNLGERIGYRDADEITWHMERATGAVPVSSEDRYKSAQALADVEADEPGIWDAIKSTFISDAGAATAPVDVSDITRPINPSVSRPGGDLPKGFEALVQLIQSDPDFSKKYIGPRDATVTTPLLANLMSATPVETFEDIPFFQPGAETRWTPPAPAIPDITQALTDFSAIRDADEDRMNREQDERERELEQAADDRREAAQQKTIETARNKTARKKVIAKENKERKAEEKRISDKQAASEKKRRATDKQMADMLKQMNETHQAYLGRKKKEEDRRLRQGYGVGDMWT